MAKDPAFLWYPGDYITGTMYLNFECKGAYVELLMLQFQKDHLTIHMIKQVLGHKFDEIWPLIQDKFKEDDGKYWNERLREEKEKRSTFCESRRNNRNSTNTNVSHMSPHMENENKDCINTVKLKENGKAKKWFSGNFKSRGEEVMAKRFREGIEAANKNRSKDNQGKE